MSRGSRSRSARAWAGSVLLLWAGWLAVPAMAAAPARVASSGAQTQQSPAALYHNYCSVCHGDKGDGNSQAQGSMKPPPRDFTSPQASQELTRDRMLAAVKGGVPRTAMVGWKNQMTDDQIAKVVDYVRSTYMRPSISDSDRGRKIYARVCSVCHGERGNGSMWASANLRPAPRDFTTAEAKADLSREKMLAAVNSGRPKTAMQGYGTRISAEDQAAVIDYIRTAIMRVDGHEGISGTHARGVPANPAKSADGKGKKVDANDHSVHNHGGASDPNDHAAHGHGVGGKLDMKAPLPQGLKGNIAAGRKFYEANCATCHGTKGDGQGPRAYFINPKPRAFTSAESRSSMSRPVIYDGVATGRRGTEMPAWDKVLSSQEIADVSEYLFRAFIQPGAKVNVAKRP